MVPKPQAANRYRAGQEIIKYLLSPQPAEWVSLVGDHWFKLIKRLLKTLLSFGLTQQWGHPHGKCLMLTGCHTVLNGKHLNFGPLKVPQTGYQIYAFVKAHFRSNFLCYVNWLWMQSAEGERLKFSHHCFLSDLPLGRSSQRCKSHECDIKLKKT